jgi:hypothetical protein
VGFLSSPACVALLIDMIVGTLTEAISTLPKGLSPSSWLDDPSTFRKSCTCSSLSGRSAPVLGGSASITGLRARYWGDRSTKRLAIGSCSFHLAILFPPSAE